MKHAWMLLLAVSCASPPASKPELQISPAPSEPSAFHVEISDREPETRRYRIQPEDVFQDPSNPELHFHDMGSDGSAALSEATPAGAAGAVARLVREFVAPDSWERDPRRAVYVDGSDLVIRHTPEVLDRAERLISTLKSNRGTQVMVKARFISVSQDELAFLDHLPMVKGGLGGIVEASTLVKTPLRNLGGRVVTAPKLTLYHGQKGCIKIGYHYAYIAGYEKKGEAYHPIPSTEWSGVELTAQVVANGPGSDRRFIKLAVKSRDVETFPNVPYVKLGNRLIEKPLATESRIEDYFVVGPGQAVVLLAPEVRAMDGIIGHLADESRGPARMNLILVELD